jgi:gliding motility-associated-like protein
MKRPITNLVLGLALLFSFKIAAQQPTFSVSPATINSPAGSTITVDVKVSNFTQIQSFQYVMSWNPASLQYVSVSNIASAQLPGFSDANFNGQNAGNLIVNWYHQSGGSSSIANGTTIYTLTFNVLSTTGTNLSFVSTPTTPIEVINAANQDVGLNPVNAAINGGGGGGGSNALTFTAASISAAAGSSACVNVTVQNFTNLIGMQFSINYNAAVLQYTGVQGFNLAGLSASNFNNPSSGNLVCSWDAPGGTPVSVANGTAIFQVCFTVIGTSGQTGNVSFSGNPSPIEVINSAQQTVTPTMQAGTVTVTGGSGGGTSLTFTAANVTAAAGSNTCVDVTVQNFTNIIGMQFSINYNAAVLQYTGVQGFNLSGLSVSNFNNPSSGNIVCSWDAPGGTPVSVANGTAIFKVCFNVIGSNGQTGNVSFSGSPSPIEVINGSQQTVTPVMQTGAVTVGTGGGGGPTNITGFAIYAVGDTIPSGTDFCIDIKCNDFNDIASMQFSMHFNSSQLTFDTILGFNPALTDLTYAGNFNTSGSDQGTLTMYWLDPTTNGVTIANAATLFRVCFRATGANNCSSSTQFSFDGNPLVIEVTNGSGQTVTWQGLPGTIQICSMAVTCNPVLITSQVLTQIACKGASTGAIDISVSGGNNQYTYKWTNSAGQTVSTSQDLSGVPAGTYTVMVTSCSGTETKTQNFTLTEPANAISITSTVTHVACFNELTGAIDISVVGGTTTGANCTGYTYKWSNGPTTQDVTGLAAGAYVVTVTDCNACQQTASIPVTAPPSLLTVIASSIDQPKCFGVCDGKITVSASGGTTPYIYKLDNGTFLSNPTFMNVCAGPHVVTVRDGSGCVKTVNVTLNAPAEINLSSTAIDASNGCNGSINLTVTGGTPQYTYNWSGPSGPMPGVGEDPTGLCAGNYFVTVSDMNSCTKTKSQAVIAPLTASGTVKNACFGGSNGQISIIASGGVAPLTYTWNPNVSTTANATNLAPGAYAVTVSSPSSGQSQTLNFTVTQAASPVSFNNPNIENVSLPGECDGSITANASGGFGSPFTYAWSNGGSTSSLNQSLCEGTYTVTATDQSGCTGTFSGTVEFDPVDLVIVNAQTIATSPKCFDSNDGTIKVVVTGGLPPYTIEANGPTAVTPVVIVGTEHTFTGLASGDYTIVVTDSAPGAAQQTKTTDRTIGTTLPMTISPVVILPATATQSGAINITPGSGQLPYSYIWSFGSTAQDPTNVPAGIHEVTLGDGRQCFQVFSVEVGLFEVKTENTLQPPCENNTGTINVTVAGSGNTPYTYTWKNSSGVVVGSNDDSFTGLPGVYTLQVTDALGVSFTETYELAALSNLDAEASIVTDFNGFSVKCNGDATGQATVEPLDGTGPYSYQWSNGASSQTISNLTAGNYTVTVEDQTGCAVVKTVSITQPQPLTSETTGEYNGCANTRGGQATATVSGGVTPYSYLWDDPVKQKVPTAILLDGGDYRVTITDANGCTMIETISIDEPEPLTLTTASKPDEGGPDGEAIAIVEGGTWPFEFKWFDYTDVDSVLTELLPGSYMVRVKDANNCDTSAIIKVDDATQCLEFLPIITPEGDGNLEFFVIGCLSRYNDNTLEIYNRWGQLVYQAKNYNDGDLWHGTNSRGEELADGVYYFVFEYLDPASNQRLTHKGSVTVLRK